MKELTRIRLINWHYFVDQTLDLRGSTLLTGDNGSGKSTILDAMQVVLVADLRQVKFNISAFKETKRNLLGYVRCKTGSDAEDGRTYLRVGDVTSYVALEFYDTRKKKSFVLGAVVDSYRDNTTYKIQYFKAEDTGLDRMPLMKGRRPHNIREFKDALRGKKAVVYPSADGYRQDLLNKLGALGERFFSLFVKAISFKPITDIRDFVYSYVLEERRINIEVMRENLQRYKEYSDLAVQTREKITALDGILRRYGEIERVRKTVLEQGYLIRRGTQEHTEAELEANIRQEQEKRDEQAQMEAQLVAFRADKKDLERRHRIYGDTLAANSTYQLIQGLEREIGELETRLGTLDDECERVRRTAREEAGALTALLAGAGEDLIPLAEAESLRALEELLCAVAGEKTAPDVPEAARRAEAAGAALMDGQAVLTAVGDRVQKWLWTLEGDIQKLAREEAELREHLASLRGKKHVYDPRVTKLRDLIAERAVHNGARATPAVLCELLEIPNEKWQDAVEGWLNTQRFDLIVEPPYFDAALRVYEQGKRRHNISGVGLVNTGRVLQFLKRSGKGSLAEEVRSENKYALAYARLLLGSVMKCENEQELKRHRRAVTPTCMTYRNNAARQIHFHVYETPYIGERAFARQIERKEARLQDVRAEITALTAAAEAGRQLRPLCAGREEAYLYLREHLDAFARRDEDRGRLAQKRDEYAAVDTSEMDEIRRQMKQLERRIIGAEEQIEKVVRQEGALSSDIEALIAVRDSLEEAARQAEDDRRGFAAAHPAVAEVGEKRYAKERRTKAPGEIAANFRHNRKSLDTVISNKKQALITLLSEYANRYQFGGRVDADDVGDFKAEHDKLAESELPSYEEKISRAQKDAEIQFKEHFIFKLRENVENAHTEFNYLNTALKDITFGTDRYRFVVKASEQHRVFHDMVMDTHLVEGGQSLFDSVFRERHREAMDALFDKIINLPPKYLPDSIAEFTDYRTFLDYDIRIFHSNGEVSTFSKVCREKSGGETQTPYYVAILASFVQLYRAKTNRDSIRLVMFDEAFNRMDGDRVENSLRFIRELGMQALIAAPTDKCEYIAPYVPTTLVVLRDGHYSWIEDYKQLRPETADQSALPPVGEARAEM